MTDLTREEHAEEEKLLSQLRKEKLNECLSLVSFCLYEMPIIRLSVDVTSGGMSVFNAISPRRRSSRSSRPVQSCLEKR